MKTSIYARCNGPFLTAGSVLGLLLLWEGVSYWIGKEIILPRPLSTAAILCQLVGSHEFWSHLKATLLRGLTGFAVSYLTGLFIGLISGVSRPFNIFFRPLLVAIRSTPSMALILMALIWFKSDLVTIFVIFLVVFPIVTQNVIEGISQIDGSLLEMARIYKVRPVRVFTELYLPAILPYLAAGAAAGLGLAWKVTVAAEVLAAPPRGIGTQMDNARIFLNTAEVFAWTLVLIGIGFLFDRALEMVIQRKLLYWK